MDAASVANELDQLRRDAVERVEQGILQLRNDSMEKLERESRELCQRVITDMQHERHVQPTLPTVPVERPTQGFGSILFDPTVPVRINGETLHIHRSVLCEMPFFTALLGGEWQDAVAPEVNLPCSTAEFCLLLQRFYTAEPLGTIALPVHSCAAALRLAAAAAMLLIDDRLPELPGLLHQCVVTAEDAQAAAAAASSLPSTFSEALQGLGTAVVANEQLSQMIVNAKTIHAQDAAHTLIAAHRGRFTSDEVFAATKQVMQRARGPMDVEWAAKLAREHLHCTSATAIFRSVPQQVVHSDCGTQAAHDAQKQDAQKQEALRSVFLTHLQRCAEFGSVTAAFALGVDSTHHASNHLFYQGRHQYCCTITATNALGFDGAITISGDQLVPIVQAARRERLAIAELMSQMPAALLATILSDSLLAAFGASKAPLITRLASEPNAVAKWVTAARLTTLPRSSQHILCTGLLPVLDTLSPEIATAIVQVLS